MVRTRSSFLVRNVDGNNTNRNTVYDNLYLLPKLVIQVKIECAFSKCPSNFPFISAILKQEKVNYTRYIALVESNNLNLLALVER